MGTDDEALSWKEILDSNIEEATTKKQKSKLKKEKEVSEDAGTSTITISDLDDKTLSKELSLVEKIKETIAIVHKDSSETDEKNLNKDPEKQKVVKKEKMRILQDDSKLKTDKIKVKPKDKSDSPNNLYLSPNL